MGPMQYIAIISLYSGITFLFPVFIKAAENYNSFDKTSPFIQQVPKDNRNKKSKRGSFKNNALNNDDLFIMANSLKINANKLLNEISRQFVRVY